jgi:xanthosine utilization system XapX-like protein
MANWAVPSPMQFLAGLVLGFFSGILMGLVFSLIKE